LFFGSVLKHPNKRFTIYPFGDVQTSPGLYIPERVTPYVPMENIP
jgi:hypothetical protein